MTIIPLGKQTTTAGTRKQLTATYDAVHLVRIRALPGNTNNVTTGNVTVVAATGVGASDILDSNQVYSEQSNRGNDIDATKIYFDVDTSTEGVVAELWIV